MNHIILILLRAYAFDIMAPLLGVAMGLALGAGHYGIAAGGGVCFLVTVFFWLLTSPKHGDLEWRPFESHLCLIGATLLVITVGLSLLFTATGFPEARSIVLGVAFGFVGALVASACSPPVRV